jgi:hypothetical protein
LQKKKRCTLVKGQLQERGRCGCAAVESISKIRCFVKHQELGVLLMYSTCLARARVQCLVPNTTAHTKTLH